MDRSADRCGENLGPSHTVGWLNSRGLALQAQLLLLMAALDYSVVTAPSDAEETCFAYLPSRPRVA